MPKGLLIHAQFPGDKRTSDFNLKAAVETPSKIKEFSMIYLLDVKFSWSHALPKDEEIVFTLVKPYSLQHGEHPEISATVKNAKAEELVKFVHNYFMNSPAYREERQKIMFNGLGKGSTSFYVITSEVKN